MLLKSMDLWDMEESGDAGESLDGLADAEADAARGPLTCPECGDQSFRSRRALMKHRKALHLGDLAERPHACVTCGARFKRTEHLTRHVLLHTGELPHGCAHCPARFRRRDHLQLHERRHTGEWERAAQVVARHHRQ